MIENQSAENRVLIVDDEKPIREVLSAALADEGYLVEVAEDGPSGLEMIKTFKPAVVLQDIWMPGDIDGIEALKIAKKEHPTVDFLMMSGHGTIETAVQSTKLGAWDFIEKPLSLDKIQILIKNILAYQKVRIEKGNLLHKLRKTIAMVGSSEESKRIKQLIVKMAPTAHWVLIQGERGTGKELIANNIHYLSPRAGFSFVSVKCSQVPGDLIEGELFGYEQGAILNDSEERVGKFDLAHKGSLFLADIDNLSSALQEKIYRYMQTGKVQRSGGSKSIELDVRIFASSSKSLPEFVEQGEFHQALYERLSLVPFTVSPLKERPDDVESLVNYYSAKTAASSGFHLKTFSQKAMDLLLSHEWPGNVLELKNFIERVYILTPDEMVDVHDVNFAGLNASVKSHFSDAKNFREARARFEKEYILSKIEEYKGNISKTAEAIGLERSYLHRKIKSFGIEISE